MAKKLGRDLFELWSLATEAEPREDRPALKLKTGSAREAHNLRLELYRIRKKIRTKSKQGLDPDDPAYDTSPWDHYVIRQKEEFLEIWRQEQGPTTWEIIDTEEEPPLPKSITDQLNVIIPNPTPTPPKRKVRRKSV